MNVIVLLSFNCVLNWVTLSLFLATRWSWGVGTVPLTILSPVTMSHLFPGRLITTGSERSHTLCSSTLLTLWAWLQAEDSRYIHNGSFTTSEQCESFKPLTTVERKGTWATGWQFSSFPLKNWDKAATHQNYSSKQNWQNLKAVENVET